MNQKPKTLIVFFHARHWLPLRATNEAHLLCWKRFSKHRVIYINVGFGVPWYLLRHLRIDAVVFDTIFLSMHWSPEYFRNHAEPCTVLRKLTCVKIALPQDEFINMDVVVEFLKDVGITDILTLSEKSDWEQIFGMLDHTKVTFRTILPGYVDETRRMWRTNGGAVTRSIDVGYRAWNNPYWLGEHGRRKVQIAQMVGEAARKRALKIDINNPASVDFLIGDKWFDFLSRCRAVLGVEGGASLLDKNGSVKRRVEEYLIQHPDATFEQARDQCFPHQDHTMNYRMLTPRHFEACITRTCQILLEGRYSGVLQPWRHYIPLKNDYSNLDEVFEALADDNLVDRIVNQAYEDIVASGKWSYRSFVREVEETIIDPAEPVQPSLSLVGRLAYLLLRLRDRVLWHYAHFEASESGKACLSIVRQWCRMPRRVLSSLKRIIMP